MRNRISDFSRQSEIFDVEAWNKEGKQINIVGCGATGSWVALSLAKMGIENVVLYDYDVVEEHNIPNQAFGLDDIGLYKVDALRDLIKYQTGIEYKAVNKKVRNEKLNGIVFLLVDSMKARGEIFNTCIFNPYNEMVIETRLMLRGGYLHCVPTKDMNVVNRFKETLYSDDEAEVSACGHSLTLGCTAQLMANMAVMQIIKMQNDIDLQFCTMIDFCTNTVIEL